MPLQKDLTTIEEYNAAMELPYAGLVGLGALKAEGALRDRSTAERELRACVELCRLAELALSGDLETGRRNAYFFSAWRRIGDEGNPRDRFQKHLQSIRERLERVLHELSMKVDPRKKLTPDDIGRLIEDLRGLSNKIRQTIPRDASLRSLISASQVSSATRRFS